VRGGELPGWKAELHWTSLCRDVSRRYGEPLAERVYRLDYVWNEQDMASQVGEPDPFGVGIVVAIVAMPWGYVLSTRSPGHRLGGSLIPINVYDVHNVEVFEI
jgi:hypothetical protein